MLSIATLLNDFMPLPRIEFGKIWSWLKVNDKPVRSEDAAKRFYYVARGLPILVHPDDMVGHVYITHDGRSVFWEGQQEDRSALKAYYLKKTPKELHLPKDTGVISDAHTDEEAGSISAKHRRELLCDYYGEKKAKDYMPKTLG